MNHTTIKLTTLALAVGLIASSPAYSQGFLSGMKDKLEKNTESLIADKGKQKAGNKVGASKANSKRKASLGVPSNEVTNLTHCAGLKASNVQTGYVGDYTFQNGFSKEKRSGFIKRKAGEVTKGCIMPSLQPNQALYFEVDTKAYEKMGNSNDWQMQCLRAADPGAGALTQSESKSEAPYTVDYLSGKDMMLHCGNSEGVSDCAEGSNSSRSSAWSKKLGAAGKTGISVMAFTSTLAPAGGEKIYCQYYNKPSGKSLFAFQYLRVRG